MTDIEFRVQFMSESSGRKGSCKGKAFKVTEGLRVGPSSSCHAVRGVALDWQRWCECRVAGSLRAGVGVPGAFISQGLQGCPVLHSLRCGLSALESAHSRRMVSTPSEASSKISFLLPQ